MYLTRREILKAGTLLGFGYPLIAKAVSPGDNMTARIAEVIAAYDAQGIHRTGTDVDSASAAWLMELVDKLGVRASLDSFSFQRVDVRDARFEVGELAINGVPLYDCTYTGPEGVSGTLGEIGSGSDIGVAMVPPAARGDIYDKIIRARAENGHRAIVLVTASQMPPDGVATINAEAFTEPFGPPVLQVPNNEWTRLQSLVVKGRPGRVVAHCEYIDAVASNVLAVVAGSDESAAPVVVMTPRSGWWQCASERGGGIAAWLEIMRAVVTAETHRSVIFTANTGHELGHTGLDHYLEANSSLVKDAHLWIHLGANFAAKVGGAVRLQFSDGELREEMLRFARAAGVEPATETPVEMRPFGEARNIYDGGGRFVSILGGNGLFHHPADRFPEAVDLDVTTKWTGALVDMVLAAATIPVN